MTRAFRITDTFRLAIRWVSNHFRQTRTWRLISDDSTLGIWATRRWLTRIWWWRQLNDFKLASYEGITRVSWRTTTNWIVISDLAFRLYATCAWTRVYTFLVVASLILRTLRAGNTFWSACWRCSNISRDTRTDCLAINLTALWIRSTRWRLAWIGFNRSWVTKDWRVQKIESESSGLSNTYIERVNIERMHFHAYQEGKSTLECDCSRHKSHFDHMFQGMDQYIYF
jgi:hypothetical protein